MSAARHEIPLERRTLHGHFSRDLEPILEIESGDTIAFGTLDSGWGLEPPRADGSDRRHYEPRDPELDAGHALIGPVAIRGAKAGQVLEVRIDSVRVGPFGFTVAGGWSTFLNDRLGVGEGETQVLVWELDADRGIARDREGRELRLSPFLGVLGMPPDEPGVHSTGPPRSCGGNLDCKELVAGTKLFLPIPVDGALFSAGDCHGLQGDGELSTTAIECPVERGELTLVVRDDVELPGPVALTEQAWLTLGLGADLDEAMVQSVDAMLDLMEREYGLERREALALASLVVDLRVTQVVNGVVGVHAVLPRDALAKEG
jgi:acetamidase/formamidase